MKMLDFVKTETYASMKYDEKLDKFKNDEYFAMFYDDILSSAVCHRRSQPIGQKQGLEELCVRTYEQALKYVERVRGARNPEVKIGEVTEDIATYYYNNSKNAIENNDDGILFSKTNYQKIAIGRVVEAIFIICTWDLIDNNDEGVVKQLREARDWIYYRESYSCDYLKEMNFWKQLADRIPDYRHPSMADLRRRVIELERHCDHWHEMYMEARAELDKEKEKINQGDDDETARLREEIARLKNDNEDSDVNFDNIIPHDKVRLELLCKLFEKAGLNWNVYAVKTNAGKLCEYLTQLPPSTCKNYMTYRDISKNFHTDEIDKINTILEQLSIDIKLT